MPFCCSGDEFIMLWPLTALPCCEEGFVGDSALMLKLLLSTERLETVVVKGDPVAPECSWASLVSFFLSPKKEGIVASRWPEGGAAHFQSLGFRVEMS